MAENNTATNKVCDYIKSKIIERVMFPGYNIVEENLAKELGISRTPLRRALSMLKDEGFVDIIPNKGSFIVSPSYEEMKPICESRISLELGIADNVINNVTDNDIFELEDNFNKQIALIENFSIVEYAVLNRAFHCKYASMGANDYTKRYLFELYNRSFVFLLYYDNTVNNAATSGPHAHLLRALKTRDLDLLKRSLHEDIEICEEAVKQSSTRNSIHTISLNI